MVLSRVKIIDLPALLDAALTDMYHNATPNFPALDSDFEQDLFNSWFEDIVSYELADIKHDSILGDFVKQYGPVHTFGRGGRTVAPDKLIVSRGGSSFRVARTEDLDLTPLEARKLLKNVNEFNRSVVAWNKHVPEMWRDAVEANEWVEEIEANKGKRRKQITVYR